MKRLVQVSILSLLALVAFTYWALEGGGVAVVETEPGTGTPRQTHIWLVERDGALWIEAAAPSSPWFIEARRAGELRLVEPERLEGRYALEILPPPDGHRRIRALMREEYGVRDLWVSTLADTSRSIGIRLHRIR